jgi:hypothetical protein
MRISDPANFSLFGGLGNADLKFLQKVLFGGTIQVVVVLPV